VVDDKPVNEVTVDDAIDYAEWWRDRVINDDVVVKSANKDIGQLSRMLTRLRLRPTRCIGRHGLLYVDSGRACRDVPWL
jgi:hypothetical protein